MGRVLTYVAFTLAIVAAVLAITRQNPSTRAATYGARMRGDRVRFTFSPRRYRWATFGAERDSIRMNELRVRRVALVGTFNDWSPIAWPMDEDEGAWRITRPLAELGNRDSATFTFVVNDRFWVEAPLEATNRRELASGSFGLALPAPGNEWGAKK